MGCTGAKFLHESNFHEKYQLQCSLREESLNNAPFYAASRPAPASRVRKVPAQTLAVKVVDVSTGKPNFKHEVSFLRRVGKHPRVIRLVETFNEDGLGYIVVERLTHSLLQGLDVMPFITECSLCGVFRQMLEGIRAVHAAGVVHRDIKPESFLWQEHSLKLCDFGNAEVAPKEGEGGLKGAYGTPAFMAPEMLVGKWYRFEVDMWSFGVILYALIHGNLPWDLPAEWSTTIALRSSAGALKCKPTASCTAVSFTERLLQIAPLARPTASQALRDRFLSPASKSGASDISLRPQFNALKAAGKQGANEKGEISRLDLQLASLQEKRFGETSWARSIMVAAEDSDSSMSTTCSTMSPKE